MMRPSRSDGLLGLRQHRLLAGDIGDVIGRKLDRLGVIERFAQTDIDHDLRDPRRLHDAGVAKLLHQRRDHLVAV